MKRHFALSIFGRRIVFVLLAVQVAFYLYLLISTSKVSIWIQAGLVVLSFFAVLHIISKREKGGFKIIWILLILVAPLFGGFTYILIHAQSSTKKFRNELLNIEKENTACFYLPRDSYIDAEAEFFSSSNLIRYLQAFAGFPIYDSTESVYLSPGEKAYECMLTEIKKAKKYIFLEYFIIAEGKMWDGIHEILLQKVKEGVDVRVLYDDLGSFFYLSKDFYKELQAEGIKALPFHPFKPFLAVVQNNRDHRKILVVDGKVAFTGGVNIADEYINQKDRLGHWKDSAIMLKGKAAWSFTVMFLEMWMYISYERLSIKDFYLEDETKKIDEKENPQLPTITSGFYQPYTDSPMDQENVGEHVYMHIINNAKHYVYINSPYLIIDDSMISALSLAAKSGVDVRITTPARGDKWFVHTTTRSYYKELIENGVKIYEYSLGFIHSKTFVSDDRIATVGTTNLDYRSLYHHFECGVCLYNTESIKDIYADYMDTIKVCKEITLKDCKVSIFRNTLQEILRVIAPLL